MILNFFLVAIGGGLGSMLRYFISMKCKKHFIGTWIANVSGSILLGFITRFYVDSILMEEIWLFIGVGFCGAYTTFSTFGHETIQLMLARKVTTALLYVLSSFVITIFFVSIILFM